MRARKPLDKILNSEIKTRALRFLCRTDIGWNGRQIAKEIKVSPASCHKALRELNNERLLLLRNLGKSFLYSLNNDNIIITNLIKPLYQAEGKLSNILFDTIKKGLAIPIKKHHIVSLAVFGSFAKGKEWAASDIDLLVLLSRTKNKNVLTKAFEQLNEKILSRFGNTISPYFQSVKEFKLKCKRNHRLTKDILQSHKLLFGKSLREPLWPQRKQA